MAQASGGRRRPINFLITPNPAPQNEPAIGVHLLDPQIMVAAANDYRRGNPSILGVYRSLDAGFTWSNRVLPLPRGHVSSGDPVVCYGYPDLFLVGGAAYKGVGEENGGSIIVYRSEDAGESFSGPIIIQEGFNEQTFNDKPWFAVDTAPASRFQGRAYVAYTRFMDPGTIIFFQRSEDRGRTWSTPIALTGIESDAVGTFITIGRHGEVYVAWIEQNERADFVLRRSLDGGRTFGPKIRVARFRAPAVEEGLAGFEPNFTFRTFTFAFLGADTTTGPNGGRLYAVWQQVTRRRSRRRGSRKSVDVMMSWSDDRGETWSRPFRATDTPNGRLSFFPFITVSPTTGTVFIAYYTNRVVRDRLDVFLVRARDHGCRFLPDQRVTNLSFDPNADPLGENFIGDYIGAAALPDFDRAAVVWCDTRRGNEDIFTATLRVSASRRA